MNDGLHLSEEAVAYLRDERDSYRDRVHKLEAEVTGLRTLIEQIDKTLRSPAAEFVIAISDVYTLIDTANKLGVAP
jgi:prefoldin subunit 5